MRIKALAAIDATIGRHLDVNIDLARLLEDVRGLLFVFNFNQYFSGYDFVSLVRLSDKALEKRVD